MEPKFFREAEQAFKRRDRTTAYQLIRQVLLSNPTYVPAWILMSKVVDDVKQQRDCLERALQLDPDNTEARDGLESLRVKELLSAISLFSKANQSPTPPKLGEYLIKSGMLTESQLQDVLFEQRKRKNQGQRTPLGVLLIQRGILTPEALAQALVSQQTTKIRGPVPLRLGEYLVHAGMITEEQLKAALSEQLQREQRGEQILLGEILVFRGYLTVKDLERILELQRSEFFGAFSD